MHSPVDIRDFLLILAGAISDRLTDERLLGPSEGLEKSFWERARGFLPSSVVPKEVNVKMPLGDLKLALQVDASFRDEVRKAFSGRLGELVQQVRDHHAAIRAALKKRAGKDVKLVIILDSLEHLRVEALSLFRAFGDTGVSLRNVLAELADVCIKQGDYVAAQKFAAEILQRVPRDEYASGLATEVLARLQQPT